MATPESMASDPATAPSALASLAYEHPELQPQIAQNPAAYDELLNWISQYGTAEGVASANQRIHGGAQEPSPAPTPEPAPTPTMEPAPDAVPSVSPDPTPSPSPELFHSADAVPSTSPDPVPSPSPSAEPQDEYEDEHEDEYQGGDDVTRLSTEGSRRRSQAETSSAAITDSVYAPRQLPVDDGPGKDPTFIRSGTGKTAAVGNVGEQTVIASAPPRFTPGMNAGTFPGDTQTLPAPVPLTTRAPTGYPQPLPAPSPEQSRKWAQSRRTEPGPTGAPIVPPTPGMPRPGMPAPPRAPQGFGGQPIQQAPAPASEPAEKGWPVVLLGVLIGLLAALLIGAITWFFFLRDDGGSSAGSETQTMAEADAEAAAARAAEEEAAAEEADRLAAERAREEEAARAAQEEEETRSREVRFPAPTNAVAISWLISPSSNISCQLDAESVRCSIYAANFDLSAPGCTAKPYTIIADEDGTRWDCTLPPVSNASSAPTLGYGSYAASGDVACQSNQQGMSCWDTISGYSFAIARQGFMMGSNGVISQSEFPWN